jgi:transposase
MARKSQKFKSYSADFKLKAVKMYLNEHMSYSHIAKELGVYDHKYIIRWVKNYNKSGIEGLSEHRGRSASPFKGRSKTKPKWVFSID